MFFPRLDPLHPPRRRARRAALALAVLLVGCGGGVWVGVGDDDFDDEAPDVELVASPDPATSGGQLELRAAASDDSGFVESVEFYRVEGDELESLGRDDEAPFRLQVRAPTVSRSTVVEYVARAQDDDGHRSDSPVLAITVNP
ncbi:Ig-like domain-containing protein [Caldimonas brevitalea]|nr:Ig-like domain-containing protein [Caldimonas brevitalea]